MLQEKYEDAIEPSERAYDKSMELLGNHPQTVHSIFQQRVIQAKLGIQKNNDCHISTNCHNYIMTWLPNNWKTSHVEQFVSLMY